MRGGAEGGVQGGWWSSGDRRGEGGLGVEGVLCGADRVVRGQGGGERVLCMDKASFDIHTPVHNHPPPLCLLRWGHVVPARLARQRYEAEGGSTVAASDVARGQAPALQLYRPSAVASSTTHLKEWSKQLALEAPATFFPPAS